jgi:hypothetical protein
MKTLTTLLSILIIASSSSYAQDKEYDVVQFYKGKICDIKVGTSIGDILLDGEILEVEKHSGEGNAYFIFNINVLNCGVVRAYVGDQWMRIFSLETSFPKYSTVRGAKVGMTLGEIRKLYPNVSIRYPETDFKFFSVSLYLPEEEGDFTFNAESLREECKKNYEECKKDFDDLNADIFETYDWAVFRD